MRVHRFYVNPEQTELKHDFWLRDERLIPQWQKVLRFRVGQEVVLFDGVTHDRLYKITELEPGAAHVELITDYVRKTPGKDIYLFWALLKKDKNDWVLQKCTELGVSHFVPLLTERCEKTGFDETRAQKIIIEASEQCGRSDIPSIREPMGLETALQDYNDKIPLYICEQEGSDNLDNHSAAGVLIGPEGGWSGAEKELFKSANIKHLNLHDFTLRAETAAVTAAAKLLQ